MANGEWTALERLSILFYDGAGLVRVFTIDMDGGRALRVRLRLKLKASHIVAGLSGMGSILLWLILIFFNPYTDGTNLSPALNTFIMLFLPGCLALIAVFYSYRLLLLIAFGWSILPSLYLTGTPGIFAWFGVASLGYLFAYLLMKPRLRS
ncbi:hypothetical protein [Paenibacillus glucanolyticus]|uniref:hypothetical protein n=1 Tax=Paenibacillus glucanolyticus TaxID=59843 RepID=UPI001E594916|nr:hypothetical protein [Paenibacillus glucanolyticus]